LRVKTASASESGAVADAKDNDGCVPLHLAASRGHDPSVELLLEYGADRSLKNKRGRTAYETAVGAKKAHTAQILDGYFPQGINYSSLFLYIVLIIIIF